MPSAAAYEEANNKALETRIDCSSFSFIWHAFVINRVHIKAMVIQSMDSSFLLLNLHVASFKSWKKNHSYYSNVEFKQHYIQVRFDHKNLFTNLFDYVEI